MDDETKGWTRVVRGLYRKRVGEYLYEIIRYVPDNPLGGGGPRWLVYGMRLPYIPAYWDLKSAQIAAHEHARATE